MALCISKERERDGKNRIEILMVARKNGWKDRTLGFFYK